MIFLCSSDKSNSLNCWLSSVSFFAASRSKADGDATRDYQPERDEITRGLVRDVRHYVTQLEKVDKAIADFLPRFGCTLNTIPGVSDTTVAKLLSEIGDIRRFPNADKLANFAGIAPVKFSSSGKGDDKPSKQGNKRLQGTIYFLAIQMIQLSFKGLPRNLAFRRIIKSS